MRSNSFMVSGIHSSRDSSIAHTYLRCQTLYYKRWRRGDVSTLSLAAPLATMCRLGLAICHTVFSPPLKLSCSLREARDNGAPCSLIELTNWILHMQGLCAGDGEGTFVRFPSVFECRCFLMSLSIWLWAWLLSCLFRLLHQNTRFSEISDTWSLTRSRGVRNGRVRVVGRARRVSCHFVRAKMGTWNGGTALSPAAR